MRSLREDWPETRPRGHAGACGCRGCRVRRADRHIDRLATQSLSTALRHAQDPWEDAWEAGRASTTTLPAISVPWSAPVSLKDLVAGTDPRVRPFKTKGKLRLYRIHHAGGRRPLYVGMVHGSGQSVAGRIGDHVKGKKVGKQTSETFQLAQALKGVGDPGKLMIRYADLDPPARFRNDKKFLHGVEMLLHAALRPQIHNPGSLTFEDEEDEGEDFVGLEAGEWKKKLKQFAQRAGLAAVLAGAAVPGPPGVVLRDVGRAVAAMGGIDSERKKYLDDTPPRRDPSGTGPPKP